jgi:hypothetical protein
MFVKHCIECLNNQGCDRYEDLSYKMSLEYNDPDVLNLIEVIKTGSAKMKEYAEGCDRYMHFDAN